MEDSGLNPAAVQESLLEAALAHVPFDGWSQATFQAAARDAGVDLPLARVICPRGAVDLAVAYHRRGDAAMRLRLAQHDLAALRFRERVALAVRLRLGAADRELVRRAAALFALPQHAGTGSRLIWGTADAIWEALGDSADDLNWYSKRATLAAVLSATVLYWLGDSSEGDAATWEFLDRRIENVMQIEKLKAQVQDNRVLRTVFAGPMWLAGKVKAPGSRAEDLPGQTRTEEPAA
ncbi:MAG: COQ9 family protein [Defluviimonas sp.]|nr:COQ9 family protein [Defluviimonas sp.]